MQWTKIAARRKLCELVFSKLSDPKGLEKFREIFHWYLTTGKNEVTFVEKPSDLFHALGCHFIQSAIGFAFPFEKWTFDSLIEYKLKPLKKNDIPCHPCIWKKTCSKFKASKDKLMNCPFRAKGQRRFDLCWIEKSLLGNVAITAEVETGNDVKNDLAKLFSIFKNSTSRYRDGFDSPIVHVQLDLSGSDSNKKTIKNFMSRHFSSYCLSPSLIYINQKANFSEMSVTYFHRKRIIKNMIYPRQARRPSTVYASAPFK